MALRVFVCLLALIVAGAALTADSFLGTTPGLGPAQWALLGIAVGLAATGWLPFEWRARVVLVVGACLLALVLTEIGLRVVFRRTFAETVEADARLIYRLRPGANRYFRREAVDGGGRILIQINHDGFRGRPLLPHSNHTRVLVYGDSFIEAEFSNLEQTFTQQLERVLQQGLRGVVEVVNAGVSGYGPDQHLLRMPDDIERLRPRLVVVALYAGNDHGDLMRNRLVQLNATGNLCVRAPTVAENVQKLLVAKRRRPYVMRVFQRVLLAEEAWRKKTRGGPDLVEQRVSLSLKQNREAFERYILHGDRVVRDIGNDPEDLDIAVDPAGASARYKIELMAQVLEQIIATAAGANTPLVFVIVPPGMDVIPRYQNIQVDSAEFPHYRRERLSYTFDSLLTTHGAEFVNLYQPYVAQGAEQFFFRGNDSHWNDWGQQFAAEMVGSFLLNRGFPPAPPTRTTPVSLASC